MPADRRKRSKGQRLPWWLLLLKHSQAIVTAGMTVGVLYYHNTQAVYLTCTSLATSFLAKGLKKVIRQPRPEGSLVKTPGMPSTHSATGTYIALYLAVLLARPLPGPFNPLWLEHARPFLVPSLVTFPILMMYSRVRLGVHTPAQCMLGGALGGACTAIFLAIWRGWPSLGAALHSSVLTKGLAADPRVAEYDALVHDLLSVGVELALQR